MLPLLHHFHLPRHFFYCEFPRFFFLLKNRLTSSGCFLRKFQGAEWISGRDRRMVCCHCPFRFFCAQNMETKHSKIIVVVAGRGPFGGRGKAACCVIHTRGNTCKTNEKYIIQPHENMFRCLPFIRPTINNFLLKRTNLFICVAV